MKEVNQNRQGNTALFLYSDGTELNLLSVPEDMRDRTGANWSEPFAKAGDNGGSYRFINYLDQSGLLKDNRAEAGVGWRTFSYVDCIYLELVIALRKMGVKFDTLKYLYPIFSEPFVAGRTATWLDILLCVHVGVEIEVFVDGENGVPLLADPSFAHTLGTGATGGQIRVSLSEMVNTVRERRGMKPIKIKVSMSKLNLNDDEAEAVMNMRDMKKEETITIKKRAKGTLIEKTCVEDANSAVAKKLAPLVGEEFGSINAQVEGGKVVSVRKTAKKVIPKN